MAITDISSVMAAAVGQSVVPRYCWGVGPPQVPPALLVHAVTARPVLGAQGSFRV